MNASNHLNEQDRIKATRPFTYHPVTITLSPAQYDNLPNNEPCQFIIPNSIPINMKARTALKEGYLEVTRGFNLERKPYIPTMVEVTPERITIHLKPYRQ